MLQIDATSPEEAKQLAELAAQKLLANPVMEQFTVEVLP
jgi:phosphoribosylformylglycinamidine synthase